MGMAGGAYKGDMERARLRMQAAQIANSRRAQLAHEQHQKAVLAEQARQADMADARANRALDIQEQRNQPAPETLERRSPISAFSNADMLAAARQRAQDRRLAELEGQNSVLGQFEQVVGMEKRQQAAKKAHGQATMAALMKVAMANGGRAPMAALNFANRQFGFDGKTRAIGGAGFAADGTWFVDFLSKDKNGQLARQTSTMPLELQGQVYYGQAGIFDNADRAAWRKRMLDSRFSTQEVNTYSGLNATALEGLDEAGLQRLEQGFVDPASGGDWKRDLAYRKQALAEARFAQALGQKSLDAAQKYALYHFKDFGNPRKATQEDVDNGLAKKVGDPFMPTPKMQFDEAVQLYKDNMGGEDPATSAAGRDSTVVSTKQYGLRNDGKTYKGTGWLGELKLPNGGVATEYTMQSDAVRDADGNRIDFPTLVPTLTKDEVNLMVNDIIPNNKAVPDDIAQKAVDFAKMRIGNGMSVFVNDGQPPVKGNPQNGNGQPPDGNANPQDGNANPPNGNEPPPAPGAPEQPEQPAQPGGENQPPIQAGTVAPPPAPGIEDGGDIPVSVGGMAGGEQQGELDFGGGGGGAAPAEGGDEGGGAPVDAGGGEGGGGDGGDGGGGAPPPPPPQEQPEDNGNGGMAADANGGTQQSGGGMASGANGGKTEAELEAERKRKKWQGRVRRR